MASQHQQSDRELKRPGIRRTQHASLQGQGSNFQKGKSKSDCFVFSLQGAICLDILGNGWSPVGTIKTALLSLRMLLEAPNPKDPQDAEVAKMMMEDHDYFESVAHDWAVKYAGAPRKRPSPEKVQRKASEKKEDDIARSVVLSLQFVYRTTVHEY